LARVASPAVGCVALERPGDLRLDRGAEHAHERSHRARVAVDGASDQADVVDVARFVALTVSRARDRVARAGSVQGWSHVHKSYHEAANVAAPRTRRQPREPCSIGEKNLRQVPRRGRVWASEGSVEADSGLRAGADLRASGAAAARRMD